jgi:hypothetical protein
MSFGGGNGDGGVPGGAFGQIHSARLTGVGGGGMLIELLNDCGVNVAMRLDAYRFCSLSSTAAPVTPPQSPL